MRKEEFGKVLGDNVKRLRLQKGLTQIELGSMCGYEDPRTGKTAIHKLESGKGLLPIDRLLLVARALDTPFSSLFIGLDEFDAEKNNAENVSVLSLWETEIFKCLEGLNRKGQEKVMDYVKDLVASGLYYKD